jgi:FSR family fosmidomycin resistance protein-like MFS transporter
VTGCVLFHLGWRPVFAACALLTLPALSLAAGQLRHHEHIAHEDGLLAGLIGAVRQLRRWEVLRWLTLLECADLLMDVLLGYLGLYFVDVAGASTSEAAIAVTVWTVAGLAGNLLLLPLLNRVNGLRYLRVSGGVALIVFPALLLVPALSLKLLLVGCLALLNAGWYPVLQARLYAELSERSGTAMAVGTIFGTGAAILPFLAGQVAQRAGLHVALWLLLAGPIVLLIGTPRSSQRD